MTIFAGRSSENCTSSAVKSLPSWNFTSRRSRISQVVASRVFHDSASPGTYLPFASTCTRQSKKCEDKVMLFAVAAK